MMGVVYHLGAVLLGAIASITATLAMTARSDRQAMLAAGVSGAAFFTALLFVAQSLTDK